MKNFLRSSNRVGKLYKVENITNSNNPYLEKFLRAKRKLKFFTHFFDRTKISKKNLFWRSVNFYCEPLCRKYSWAIPDERALKILQNFGALIELGAGKGYWAALLRARGVDIAAYDRYKIPNSFTDIEIAGPEALLIEGNECRTLFLSYPDEDSQLSTECIKYYHGDYIIHVGELMNIGTNSGFPQAPFGRTTNSEFQILLNEMFHCVLVAELPCLPFARDTISVWKRSYMVPGRNNLSSEGKYCEYNFEEEENEEQELSRGNETIRDPSEDVDDEASDESSTMNDWWVDIPPSERLPVDRAASDFQHLL